MAQQIINVGASANDGTGDTLRLSQQKTNDNTTELYNSKVESVVAGTNVTVDNTDPLNPIVSATGGGGGTLQEVTDLGATTDNAITVQGVTISGNTTSSLINIGQNAGDSNLGTNVINIGITTGLNNTGDFATNIGTGAGTDNTGSSVTNIGYSSGGSNSANNVTNIGQDSGFNNTGNSATNIGQDSGYANTFDNVINLGQGSQSTATNQLSLNTGIANTAINLPTTATELTLRDSSSIETIAYLSDITAGETDLSYTASPTDGIVVSSTGTDATIPLADGTNAGLILLDSFGDVIIDTDFITAPTIGTITQPTLVTPTGSVILNGLPAADWVITETPTTSGLTGLTGSTSTTTITGLTDDTTYTFKVTSDGETSVASANAVIDPQPVPAEYFVRPLGTTYGDSSGTSFANAWTGFSGVNWAVLNTKTLNVVGTHLEELNVQQSAVTIVGNHVSGAGIINAQSARVCLRINGYNNITVNNLSMINGQTSNAHNMLTTGTIYNNCTFDTSGNQTVQHEGNVISDIISVTYNNCTFKNGADDGVSLHGNNTTVVLNNCSMENNSQGVNAINTGVCTINDSNFLNNTVDVQPDSSSDITVNRSTFRSQLSANSSVALKINNCTMLSGETVITSLGSIEVTNTKYLGLSKITTNQTDISKVKIRRCYFEVSTIAKVTSTGNAVYDLNYSIFKHISGTNVYAISTVNGGTGTSIVNNCTFVGSSSTGRGIAAGSRITVKNTIFQGLNLVVNPNGALAIVVFDKCCTYLNTTINVNQNGGTFTNTNSITTNPLITDIVNLDFSLQSGSSCWNTGATLTDAVGILSANWVTGMPTVTTKTQPATWDIGAYIH